MKPNSKSAGRSRRLMAKGNRPWCEICKASIATISAFAVPAVTLAGLYYWTGDHDGNWNTTGGLAGTNWSSSPNSNQDTSPAIPGSADDVFFAFPGAGNLTTALGQNFSIKSLTFTPDAVAANPVTIGGSSTLALGSGGLTVNSNAVLILSTAVALGATQTWTDNSTAGNPLKVSGVISGPSTNTLSLAGPGTFNFSGANSYSGATVLSTVGTTLTLSGANGSILNTSAITLSGGATLTLDNTLANNATRVSSTLGITSNGGSINLIGNVITPTLQTIGTLALGSGTTNVGVTGIGATLTLGSGGAASLAHSLGSNVNFSSTGVIIAPNAPLTNNLIGGWATIGNPNSNDPANVLDFASVATSGTVGQVLPLGALGTPGGYTTLTNLQAGTGAAVNAQISTFGTSSAPSASTTTLNSLYVTGNAAVDIDDTSGDFSKILVIGSGGIISNAATATWGTSGQNNLNTNALIGSVGGNATPPGNNTSGFAPAGQLTSGTSELDITTASNLRINAEIVNNGTNAVTLVKNGSGVLDLSDGNGTSIANTYSGGTVVNGGVILVRADANLGAVPGSLVTNSITLNGGEIESLATFTLNANRGITVGTNGGTIAYAGGSTVNLNAPVTGPGSFTLFANAISTGGQGPNLVLNNSANSYQGATNLVVSLNPVFAALTTQQNNGGALVRLGVNNAIPANSPVTVTSIIPAGAQAAGVPVIDMNNTTCTIGSLAGNAPIINFNGALTTGQDNLSTTYSGNLTGTIVAVATQGAGGAFTNGNAGTGSFTKIGAGTQTLSGANNYTGATNIGTASASGGTLLVTGSLANTAVTVGFGANSGTLGGSGTIAGPVTVTSAGILAPAVTPTTTSTLTIGSNLTLSSGALLNFNFGVTGGVSGTAGIGDLVQITGSNSAVSLPANLTLNINPLSGFGIGIYKILDDSVNTGQISTSTAWSAVGTNAFNYAIVVGNGTTDFNSAVEGGNASVLVPKNTIYLEVLQGNPAYFWTGSASGIWDLLATNWNSKSSGSIFTNGSNVTFDDGEGSGTAPTTSNITVLAGGVAPASVAFNNAITNYTFSGAGGAINVSPTGTGISKGGGGSVTFNNTVSTTTFSQTAGIVAVGKTFTASTSAAVNGGTLAVSSGGVLTSPSVSLNTGGALTVASGGALGAATALSVGAASSATFNNATQTLASLTGAGSVVLNGTALSLNGTGSFGGVISGNGSGSLTVSSGIVTLSNGSNNYGITTVAGGRLVVTNTTGSATGPGAVDIKSGAVLDGTGTASGAITVEFGATLQGSGTFGSVGGVNVTGSLSPAGAGTIGAINLGALAVNNTGSLAYDVSTTSNSDVVVITGNASFAGTETLNINATPGFGPGNYILARASGTITDTAVFNVVASGPTAPTGGAATYNVQVVGGNELVLNVVIPAATWTGAISNAWDVNSTANWTTNLVSSRYQDGDPVIFDDSTANGSVNLAATVNPSSITFNNNATAYVFTGTGGISGGGATGVTLNGPGTVTFNNSANSYIGGTHLNAGTLIITSDANLGVVPVTPDPQNITLNGGVLSVTTGTSVATAGATTISTNRGIQLGPNGGTLNIGFIDTVTGSHNGTEIALVYNGQITGGTATSNFTISGQGGPNAAQASILDLNTPETYLGKTTINNAIVQVNAGAGATAGITNVLPATTVLNLVNNGAFSFDSGTSPQTIAGLTGDATGMVTTENATSTSPLTINTASGQTSNFPGTIAASTVTGKAGSNNILSVTMTGSGVQIFSGTNAYNGGTTVNSGTLQLSGAGTLGAATNALTVNGGTVDLNGTSQSVGNLTGTGGTITNTGNVDSILTIGAGGGGGGNFAGVISNGSTNKLGLTKTGAGAIILSGINTYSGPTSLEGGTIYLANAAALPASTVLAFNGSGATLDLNGGAGLSSSINQTVASLAGSDAAGAVTNSDATTTRTFTVSQTSNTTFAGSISGNLNFVKSGSGTLQLNGNNVNTGTVMVTGGNLNIGSDSSIGSGFTGLGVNVTASSGATLSGVGSVGGNLVAQTGATISPGNVGDLNLGAGIINVGGTSLDLSDSTTKLSIVLANPANPFGQQSGQLAMSAGGEITLGGALNLSFAANGYFPQVGDTYYIITGSSFPATGTFSNFLSIGNSPGTFTDSFGDRFAVSYDANVSMATAADPGAGFNVGGNDVAVQVEFAAIPEPGSLSAVLSSVGMLVGLQRFRRRKS